MPLNVIFYIFKITTEQSSKSFTSLHSKYHMTKYVLGYIDYVQNIVLLDNVLQQSSPNRSLRTLRSLQGRFPRDSRVYSLKQQPRLKF